MKIKRGKIVLLPLIILLVGVATIIALNPSYERTIEYGNYKVTYIQYLRGEKFLYPGHYVYNERLLDQAYMKLANRILDDFLQNNDSLLINEVLRISNEHNLRFSSTRKIAVDSLINNREVLLDTIIWIR